MVFNWFRRQFNDKDTPTPEEEPDVTLAEVEPETPTAAEEDVAAEYLKWAKAAYQNIQQQQQESVKVDRQSAALQEDAITEESKVEVPATLVSPVNETDSEPIADEPDSETLITEEIQADEPDAETIIPQVDEPEAETPIAPQEIKIAANEETAPLPWLADNSCLLCCKKMS